MPNPDRSACPYFGHVVRDRRVGDQRVVDKRHAAGERLPWHSHRDAYVTFVIRGGYRESLRGASVECGTATAIVHPPGEAHADAFGPRKTRLLAVELPVGATPAGRAREAFLRRAVLRGPEVSVLAAKLERELWFADDASPLVVEGVLLELAAHVLRHATSERPSVPAWLREAEAIVRERFLEPLRVAGIAEELDVDPATLARGFRRHRGTTVGEAIRRARVEYAKGRLGTGAPLADIALAAGFADQSHFTRTFACLTGITPAAYRRRLTASRGRPTARAERVARSGRANRDG